MRTNRLFIPIFTALAFALAGFQNASGQNNTTAFDVDGLKVIHKRLPGEVVAVRLYIRGGTANYPESQQGIEALAFEMALFGGTENRSSEDIFYETRDFGIGLSGKSGYDYGYLGMTALKMFWNDSWALWSESIMKPRMADGAFYAFRDELYARNRRSSNVAEERIAAQSLAGAFAGTDYAKNPAGTEESLFDLTPDDVRNHYAKILTKENCFIVVVGDIDRADLQQKIADTFGEMPAESELQKTATSPEISAGATIHHRDLEINHIQARMPAPARWSPESIPNELAMSMLSDRLNEALTIDEQIADSPSAFTGEEQKHPSNAIYAATTKPKQAAEAMVAQINRAKAQGFSEQELNQRKALFITLNYLSQETVDAQAHVLGDAEILGDWQKVTDITPLVKNATTEEVHRVFNQYSTNIHWTYLGNASQVVSGDFPIIEDEGTERMEEED